MNDITNKQTDDNQQPQPKKEESPINNRLDEHKEEPKNSPKENDGIEVADYLAHQEDGHGTHQEPEKNVYDDKLPPPIKQGQNEPIVPKQIDHNHHDSSVTSIIIIALLLITVGFGGGFYGYKYSPQIAKLFSSTADQATQDSSTTEADNLLIYTNTKYGYLLEYPKAWFGETNKSDSDVARFTSYDPVKATTGSKIEITFQEAGGKTLADWIASQKVITNASGSTATSSTPQSLTVGGKPALQEETTGTTGKVTTYLIVNTKVMTISLEAPTGELTGSKTIYNQLLESIKFN